MASYTKINIASYGHMICRLFSPHGTFFYVSSMYKCTIVLPSRIHSIAIHMEIAIMILSMIVNAMKSDQMRTG